MANILLIDDDDPLRRLFRTLLQNHGHTVTEASDGGEGVRLFGEKPFDLVITDLIMPNKEGIETILEIRKLNPKARIIAVSGGGRIGPENYLSSARSLGAAEALTKPLSAHELIDAVERVLAGTPKEN